MLLANFGVLGFLVFGTAAQDVILFLRRVSFNAAVELLEDCNTALPLIFLSAPDCSRIVDSVRINSFRSARYALDSPGDSGAKRKTAPMIAMVAHFTRRLGDRLNKVPTVRATPKTRVDCSPECKRVASTLSPCSSFSKPGKRSEGRSSRVGT